jgi:neutral trehalase
VVVVMILDVVALVAGVVMWTMHWALPFGWHPAAMVCVSALLLALLAMWGRWS